MTHKEQCRSYCIEQLKSLSLMMYYSEGNFQHYYRKHNGGGGNAWIVGSNAADFMINEAHTAILQKQQLGQQQAAAIF